MLFILEARNNTRQSGLARMCIYIIHSLSQHRSFGIQLNSPFNASQWPASSASKLVPTFSNGNWGDFFILSIHLIVTTTARSSMASLHDHLMLAVSNVASYLKSLSSATANKLLSLFNSLSHPAYLFGAESNHRVLIYLFDAINSIIQYQTAGGVLI